MSTLEYFREQTSRLAAHMGEEGEHIAKWKSLDAPGTAEELRELSVIATQGAAALERVAAAAMNSAEEIDPSPALRLLRSEEMRGDEANARYWRAMEAEGLA